MSDFVSPVAELGDIVYWYDTPDSQPQPAVVTNIGVKSLCVNIFDPSTYNMRIRDGVRHRKDPEARRPEMRESGCWDYTPRMRRAMELETLLSDPKKK